MELPGGWRWQVSLGISESDSDLYEFGLLNVMPDELIVKLFWGILIDELMFFDYISRELCILNDV